MFLPKLIGAHNDVTADIHHGDVGYSDSRIHNLGIQRLQEEDEGIAGQVRPSNGRHKTYH